MSFFLNQWKMNNGDGQMQVKALIVGIYGSGGKPYCKEAKAFFDL